MKKIIRMTFFFTILVLVSSCSALKASYQQTEEERLAVVKAIKERNFNLDINTVMPSNGQPSMHVSGSYEFKMRDDEVTCRLPYVGNGSNLMGADLSIHFNHEKVQMIHDYSNEKNEGKYLYQFKASCDSEEWKVTIELYDNATAIIGCESPRRSQISYRATLEPAQ